VHALAVLDLRARQDGARRDVQAFERWLRQFPVRATVLMGAAAAALHPRERAGKRHWRGTESLAQDVLHRVHHDPSRRRKSTSRALTTLVYERHSVLSAVGATQAKRLLRDQLAAEGLPTAPETIKDMVERGQAAAAHNGGGSS